MTTAKWTSIQECSKIYAIVLQYLFNEKGVFASVGWRCSMCMRKVQSLSMTTSNNKDVQRKCTIVNAHLQQQTCTFKKMHNLSIVTSNNKDVQENAQLLP
jgi:hypothetical protein